MKRYLQIVYIDFSSWNIDVLNLGASVVLILFIRVILSSLRLFDKSHNIQYLYLYFV
jgi:hypothetical protein